ncbi:MAG: flotillin [Actinomycetota bacterium]|nr:flotillin [Actinomycetota bacterium]
MLLYIAGAVLGAIIILIALFRAVWRVAEPNEALIISGLGAKGENETSLDSLGFKIVVGRGTSVIPGFQTVRRLGLDSRATGLVVNAVSNQSIPLTVKGVVAYKVGDDLASIANAARRFLDQDTTVMQTTIHELFAGHLRAIVGGMTVEDMLHNREELTANIRASLAEDLQKLGLRVDSLQIQEIDDESGYIQNLGKPQAAFIESKARIAAAQRDKEATEAEQVANAEKAAAVREASIKQSEYQAQMDQARSKAQQAGPLSEALARQEVVRAETAAAELDAQRQEKLLESSVRKPADARAYEQVTLAEANRVARVAAAQAQAQEVRLAGEAQANSTQLNGAAQASAIREKGLAEAAGIEARAKALSTNQDAVIAQQYAENYPQIVAAAASSLGNIDNLVVLNGAEGMEDMLAKAMTMGGAGLGLAQKLMTSIKTERSEPVEPPVAAANGKVDSIHA